MNKFRVTDVFVTIHSGVLGLTDHQASLRTYGLKPIGGGKYEVKESVQFKRNEEFEWDGDVPRNLATQLSQVGKDGAAQEKKDQEEDVMTFEPTLHDGAPSSSEGNEDPPEDDSFLHTGKSKHGRRK